MQTIAKAKRKELTQFLTVYQSIIEFSLEKMGLEVIIKYNKSDADEMLDNVNAQLINVCWQYLETHDLPLDKYQLSTIVMDLYTQTISSIDEPFKVIAKESKDLVKDYLEKNKKKSEALERIKKENEELDKEIWELQEVAIQQQAQLSNIHINNVEPQPVPKPTITPRNIPISRPTNKSTITKKAKYRGTGTADLLIDDSFSLPSWR